MSSQRKPSFLFQREAYIEAITKRLHAIEHRMTRFVIPEEVMDAIDIVSRIRERILLALESMSIYNMNLETIDDLNDMFEEYAEYIENQLEILDYSVNKHHIVRNELKTHIDPMVSDDIIAEYLLHPSWATSWKRKRAEESGKSYEESTKRNKLNKNNQIRLETNTNNNLNNPNIDPIPSNNNNNNAKQEGSGLEVEERTQQNSYISKVKEIIETKFKYLGPVVVSKIMNFTLNKIKNQLNQLPQPRPYGRSLWKTIFQVTERIIEEVQQNLNGFGGAGIKAPVVKKNTMVKIVRQGERFWCKVKSYNKQTGVIHATVANDLVVYKKKFGAPIRFNIKEVIDYEKQH